MIGHSGRFAQTPTRRIFAVTLAALWANAAVAVLVFHYAEGLSFVDACYFTVTIISTVGFGDFSLRDSQPLMKIYANTLMLTGPLTLAILVGFITDFVVSQRLALFLGRRKPTMKNHIVVCGLGQLGYRVIEHLRKQGKEVFVIEKEGHDDFIELAQALDSEILIADARLPTSLEHAQIADADALIIATDDDLANLEIAINARAIRPDLRVVLRMFDSNLAAKMESAFDIHTVFSTTALAAPAFAMAALDPRKSVVNSVWVGDELLVGARMVIKEGSPFIGITIASFEVEYRAKLLSHRPRDGEESLIPEEATKLGVGDEVTLVVQGEGLEALHSMNESVMSVASDTTRSAGED